jgi:L-lactate dehydrogenase (cytochrome)
MADDHVRRPAPAALGAPSPGRRLPRWSELAPLLGDPRARDGDVLTRRLARAASITDLRRLARRRAPRAVFDYVDGAAEEERSLRRARRSYRDLRFEPQVLRGVAEVDLTTQLLGEPARWPLVLAPTGFTRMMHHEGEPAVAAAAADHAVPYALSTLGNTSIEELRAAVPDGDQWFQLYLMRDRGASRDLVDRTRAAGFRALVLTVDTPVAGNRLRDVRNGLTVPPTVTMRTLLDVARHPRWWVDALTTEPLEFATLRHFDGTVAELANMMFDPSLGMDDLLWLREQWDGPLVVKGIQRTDDARRVVDAGADAIVVSTHGGRQLDRAPTPLRLLPDVLDEIGDEAEVYVDTGILTGADVIAAVALGATGALVGRAYLYGLMAGGRAGVDRALTILHEEAVRTMHLLGAATLAQLPGTVHLPPEPAGR